MLRGGEKSWADVRRPRDDRELGEELFSSQLRGTKLTLESQLSTFSILQHIDELVAKAFVSSSLIHQISSRCRSGLTHHRCRSLVENNTQLLHDLYTPRSLSFLLLLLLLLPLSLSPEHIPS